MEGSKGGVGGEVRRVHVVYLLSHNGKIEQPHLIRVHHLHRSGVHLRDVKRWLSDLRGMDMPESFAWSYKRRYKTGYVWQDLMDDDLITPIADNEYVLKGSELSPAITDLPPLETNTGEEEAKQVSAQKTPPETLQIEVDDGISPKQPPPVDEESPGALLPPPPSGSDASDESTKRAAIVKIDLWRQQEEQKEKEKSQQEAASFVEKRKSDCNSNNYYWWSGRSTSHGLRNLLRCGGVETNDSALLPVHCREKDRPVTGDSHKRTILAHKAIDDKSTQSCNPNDNRKSSKNIGHKVGSAVYKPAGEPNCLECGKAFKPDELHSHMKSCRAMEGRGRSSIKQEKLPGKSEPQIEELSKITTSSF